MRAVVTKGWGEAKDRDTSMLSQVHTGSGNQSFGVDNRKLEKHNDVIQRQNMRVMFFQVFYS